MSHTVELIIGIVSVAMFVGMLLAVPWIVRRLPEDYFVRPPPEHSLPIKIGRNILGGALILAGLAMLVLPGQGILTIVFGLSIIDLPIKRRALAWLLQRPKIQKGVQTLRARAGKPALLIPTHA
jgi:hypothetical protein